MNWNEELEIPRRIVAQLFALAVLAEVSAGRSLAVRQRVLAILRVAEIVAWERVVLYAYAVDLPSPLQSDLYPVGDDADAALLLAARLRLQAVMLAYFLESLPAFECVANHAAGIVAVRHGKAAADRILPEFDPYQLNAWWWIPVPDTS